MQKTNVNKALIFLVVSALVAGVGCGSGKTNKRQRTRPNANGQIANKAQVPGDLSATDGTTPSQKNAGGGNGGGTATLGTDSAERAKTELAIDAIWTPLVAGTFLHPSELELGNYTFEGSATAIKIMPGNGQWAKAASVYTIADKNFVLINQAQYGMLPNGSSDNGYSVLLPAAFSVEKRGEQPKANPQSYVLTSKFGPLPKTLTTQGLTDKLEDAGTTKPAVSLLDLVAGNTLDITKKKVVLGAWKSADSTKVRFQLAIDEIPNPSEDKETMVRTIILTYAFKAKPSEAASAAPAAPAKTAAVEASASSDQAPATAPVEKIETSTDED